eukprot:TRINITY_DN4714_c0_g1_i2.p1 TRINITY_DN4714_c0_g1~~TRINITY_DN4714_c0_g1_i2.p1  ORF type:complete len:1252 (-),score=229.89 TRINITY_DN4714_c0_g1_i2:5512-9246(-)
MLPGRDSVNAALAEIELSLPPEIPDNMTDIRQWLDVLVREYQDQISEAQALENREEADAATKIVEKLRQIIGSLGNDRAQDLLQKLGIGDEGKVFDNIALAQSQLNRALRLKQAVLANRASERLSDLWQLVGALRDKAEAQVRSAPAAERGPAQAKLDLILQNPLYTAQRLSQLQSELGLQPGVDVTAEIEGLEHEYSQYSALGQQQQAQESLDQLTRFREYHKLSVQLGAPVAPPSAPQPAAVRSTAENVSPVAEVETPLPQKDWREEAARIPDSALKTLCLLLHELSQQQQQQQPEFYRSLLAQLQEQITREDLLTDCSRRFFHLACGLNRQPNYASLYTEAVQLLQELCPFDTRLCQALIDSSLHVAAQLKDKEVILLLGPTGSGKSTTILYLAGCKMHEIQVEVHPGGKKAHIDAISVPQELRHVRSSAANSSETRLVTPVEIPYGAQKVIVCDSPGIGDTRSNEVDIANSVALLRVTSACQGAKVVHFCTYPNHGGRGEGLVGSLEHVRNFVKAATDHLASIFFVFTRYPPGYPIGVDIENLLEIVKEKGIDDEMAQLFNHMVECARDTRCVLNPLLDEERTDLLRMLLRGRFISDPADVFNFSAGLKAQAAVTAHLQRARDNVASALQRMDWELAKHWMAEIAVLHSVIPSARVTEAYQAAIKSTIHKNNDIFAWGLELGLNTVRNAQELPRVIAALSGLSAMLATVPWLEELPNGPIARQQTPHVLVRELATISQREFLAALSERCIEGVSRSMQTLLILQGMNGAACEDILLDVRQTLLHHFTETLQAIPKVELAEPDTWQVMAQAFDSLVNAHAIAREHCPGVPEMYDAKLRDILMQLDAVADDILDLLAHPLGEHGARKLVAYFEVFKGFERYKTLCTELQGYQAKKTRIVDEFDDEEDEVVSLQAIYQRLVEMLSKQVRNICGKLRELVESNHPDALQEAKHWWAELVRLRAIRRIQRSTEDVFNTLCGAVRQRILLAQGEINHCLDDPSCSDFRRVAQHYEQLSKAPWLDEATPGGTKMLLTRVDQFVETAVKDLQLKATALEVHLREPQELGHAEQILARLEGIAVLDRTISDLVPPETRDFARYPQTEHLVSDKIEGLCPELRGFFGFQTEGERLEQLKKLERQHTASLPSSQWLVTQKYVDISALEAEIENTVRTGTAEIARLEESLSAQTPNDSPEEEQRNNSKAKKRKAGKKKKALMDCRTWRWVATSRAEFQKTWSSMPKKITRGQ